MGANEMYVWWLYVMTMVTTQTQYSENILCKANLFKDLKGKISPGTKPAVDVCTILSQLLNVSFI